MKYTAAAKVPPKPKKTPTRKFPLLRKFLPLGSFLPVKLLPNGEFFVYMVLSRLSRKSEQNGLNCRERSLLRYKPRTPFLRLELVTTERNEGNFILVYTVLDLGRDSARHGPARPDRKLVTLLRS